MTDWIATFPAFFTEEHRQLLRSVENSGFEEGIKRAVEVAAAYDLEDEASDSICREIAREIAAQTPKGEK